MKNYWLEKKAAAEAAPVETGIKFLTANGHMIEMNDHIVTDHIIANAGYIPTFIKIDFSNIPSTINLIHDGIMVTDAVPPVIHIDPGMIPSTINMMTPPIEIPPMTMTCQMSEWDSHIICDYSDDYLFDISTISAEIMENVQKHLETEYQAMVEAEGWTLDL